MKPDERLSGALQENILCLLCFDEKYAQTARHSLSPQLFESALFREIAGIAIDFIDQFHAPVGEHLPDHLEHILKGEDTRKAAAYKRLVDELFTARDGVNGEYVLSQLHKFVRQQTLKSAFVTAAELFEEGNIDGAEVALQKGLSTQAGSYSPGIDMSDPEQALGFMDNSDAPFLQGIKALDDFGIGPARKQLFLVTGPLGKGKSWWLMQIGKMGILQRLKVLHITLEMSEEQVAKRYLQMMFAITKRKGGARVARFEKSFDGSIKTIDFEDLDLNSLEDDDIRTKLTNMVKRRLGRARLKVKKFASGSLTMAGYRSYLDQLERFENFVPDLVVMDYAELMDLGAGGNAENKRSATGQRFVDLRGEADTRNHAFVTASQVNRPGINKLMSDEGDLAEDISKAFTADSVCTYNQTPMEHKMGLARIHAAKVRDGESKMTALITQSYKMGQFCLDSVLMGERYLASITGRDRESEEEDEQPRTRRRVTPAR